jgi:putative hemolysin
MSGVALQITVIVLLTLINGLFAMSETALVSSRKARLKQRAEAGDRGGRAALELADSPNRFLSTVQIGISLVGVLAGAFGGATLAGPLADALRAIPALEPYAGAVAFGTVVVAITYLSLIIGELVPKRLALNGAEAVASRVAGPMRLISAITAPAVWFFSVSTEGVLRLLGVRRTGAPPVSEQEVQILMEEGAQAGVFEEEERDLVQRALKLDDRPVRELMTPRPNVVWLNADDPPEEILRQAREAGHSFFPVARRDLDDLLGIASVKEAWARQAPGKSADLSSSLQRAPLVPEGAPATKALEAFKRSGLPVALVIDERGHIEGLVTLTDVLEALIGEVPEEGERVCRDTHSTPCRRLVNGGRPARGERAEGSFGARHAASRGGGRLPYGRRYGDGQPRARSGRWRSLRLGGIYCRGLGHGRAACRQGASNSLLREVWPRTHAVDVLAFRARIPYTNDGTGLYRK